MDIVLRDTNSQSVLIENVCVCKTVYIVVLLVPSWHVELAMQSDRVMIYVNGASWLYLTTGHIPRPVLFLA